MSATLTQPVSIMEWQVDGPSRRLDLFLVERGVSPSRARLQRLILEGRVSVNGATARASMPLKPGDTVSCDLPPPEASELQPQDMPLRVVYEDGDVAVIDKPAGIAVHPAAGRREGTLANALVARWPGLAATGNVLRPGIVHRLDKDTSGLIVIAKNQEAYFALTGQIRAREMHKEYLALARGELKPARGRIEAPIGRDPRNRKRMAVVEGGRPATTEYAVQEYVKGHSLVLVTTITGRTHQIRVHMAAIGHPLLGDALYGGASPLLRRQFLHASKLGIRLPGTSEAREFTSPLPPDLVEVLEKLRATSHEQ